jgi:hypothetical protein
LQEELSAMKKLLGSILTAVFALFALAAPPAFAGDDYCWKASYGRGVGTVPDACAADRDRIGLLCYSKCGTNSKRVGFDCHSVCPSGMRDDGLFCRKSEYGRGAGYALWDEGKCKKEHSQGCEKNGALWYPKCASGYKNVGCCICRPTTPNCEALGLGGRFDLSCAKKVRIGDPTPGICGAGQQLDVGLCYTNCKTGYSGVGPVCWGQCPTTHPVNCGAGCATTTAACAENTTDQVLSVLEVVANVGLAVATAGTSTAATAGAKAAATGAKTAVKTGAKTTAKITKSAAIEVIKKQAKEAGKELSQAAIETYAEAVVQAGTTGEFDPEMLAGLDPTGIASVVVAYAKPVCKAPDGAAPSATPTRSVQGSATTPATPANPVAGGNVWRQMPGAAVDIGIGGNDSLWVIGTNKIAGGYGIYRWTGSAWANVPGAAVRIDVDPQGNPWVVNEGGNIYRMVGTNWQQIPGGAIDIGIGAGGVWVIGTAKVPGGNEIFQYKANAWAKIPGGAVRIDVDPKGIAWVVNDAGYIYRYNGNNGWDKINGPAADDIGIGGEGSVFIVGKDGSIHKWNGSAWIKRDGSLAEITVSNKGIPFGVNAGKNIYMGYP